MIYFLTLILELAILFLLSKKLIKSLSHLIYKVTKSQNAVINIMAIIFLPGTIIHELSHLIFAGMLLVAVGELEVIPQIQGDSIKLGSVQIAKSDPLRRTIIGIAPIIVGVILILGIIYFNQPANGSIIWWQVALTLFFIFEIGNTMFSSKKDLEGIIVFVGAVFIAGIIAVAVLYFINPEFFNNILNWINKQNFIFIADFFKLVSLYMLAPIILDCLLIFPIYKL